MYTYVERRLIMRQSIGTGELSKLVPRTPKVIQKLVNINLQIPEQRKCLANY